MWRALNLIKNEQSQIQHNQHENENQDNQNLDDRQAINDERNENMEYAFNPNAIETIHDNTDDNEKKQTMIIMTDMTNQGSMNYII